MAQRTRKYKWRECKVAEAAPNSPESRPAPKVVVETTTAAETSNPKVPVPAKVDPPSKLAPAPKHHCRTSHPYRASRRRPRRHIPPALIPSRRRHLPCARLSLSEPSSPSILWEIPRRFKRSRRRAPKNPRMGASRGKKSRIVNPSLPSPITCWFSGKCEVRMRSFSLHRKLVYHPEVFFARCRNCLLIEGACDMSRKSAFDRPRKNDHC